MGTTFEEIGPILSRTTAACDPVKVFVFVVDRLRLSLQVKHIPTQLKVFVVLALTRVTTLRLQK